MKKSLLTCAGLPGRRPILGVKQKALPVTQLFTVERPSEHAKLIRELGLFHCHWPLFNNFDAHSSKFCGRPTETPPYCEKHRKRANGGKRAVIAFPTFRRGR